MSSQLAQLQEATIKQHCKTLRMPMMASQFSTLAEQALREKKTHTGYLEVLLTAEIEERERNTIDRRIKGSTAHTLGGSSALGQQRSPSCSVAAKPPAATTR